MSDIGVFESMAGSVTEGERQQRIASDKMAAAVYDVKERVGDYLFGAPSLGNFRDRVATCKNDMIRAVQPHLFPRPYVMRRVCKQLEAEYREHTADFTGPLEPEGDFKGYLNEVAGGERAKVDANVFTDTGDTQEHDGDPAKTNFVKGKESRRHESIVVTPPNPKVKKDQHAEKSYDDWDHAYDTTRVDKRETNASGEPVNEWGERTGEPALETSYKGKHRAVAAFSAFCRKANVRPSLDVLDRLGSRVSDADYIAIASALQRSAGDVRGTGLTGPTNSGANQHEFKNSEGADVERDQDGPAKHREPESGQVSREQSQMNHEFRKEMEAINDAMVDPDSPGFRQHGSVHYDRYASRRSAKGASCPQCGKYLATSEDRLGHSHEGGDVYDAAPQYGFESRGDWTGRGKGGLPPVEKRKESAVRTAAPDYLQKADESLTNLLNQRAEEFQEAIAPLQQALQVVQQAEAEQQAANPFNVMPGGSINVMPGAQAGDPAAGGGAPPMDPSMGGGMPPGGDPSMGGAPMDPAAMGGDPGGAALPPADPTGQLPPELAQQMMMAKRGGQGKAPARKGTPAKTADVISDWQEWNAAKPTKGTLPTGSDVDIEQFAEQKRKGPKAIKKLKTTLTGPQAVTASTATGVTKQAWMGWGGDVEPQHKVAGWEWDDYLNAHVASKPTDFACTCGQKIAAPTGLQVCGCGKQWNSYVIGTGGDRKEASADTYLMREIPVRDGVIVASRTASDETTTAPAPPMSNDDIADINANAYGGQDSRGNQIASVGRRHVVGYGLKDFEDINLDDDDDMDVQIAEREGVIDSGREPETHDRLHGEIDRLRERMGIPRFPRRDAATNDGFARYVADAYVARESAITKLTDPGEITETEDPGTPTMKSMPSDWARRNPDGKWNQSPKPKGGVL